MSIFYINVRGNIVFPILLKTTKLNASSFLNLSKNNIIAVLARPSLGSLDDLVRPPYIDPDISSKMTAWIGVISLFAPSLEDFVNIPIN